jgi:phosphatidylserine decarboxylase
VGAPLNAVLDFMMDTPAGFAAFRDPIINAMLKKILSAWCAFLCSPASLSALHSGPNGWMCKEAVGHLNMQEVQHDPQHPHWGFSSWNDFFTRRFREGMRPVASADDHKVIVSACESTPYNIAFNAQLEAKFWLKKQPYSLRDMMANDERAQQFIGGTVYQAFLSATFYHRWHAPISGTVLATRLIPGTYYSEAESAGFDPAGPNNSQGYITHVAARALLFLQCDDAAIGLMALLFVGMAEISSCVFSSHVKEGAHLRKGEEIGYFQYGGSTHCCIFRKGVIHSFTTQAMPTGEFGAESDAPAVKLSQQIALAN